MIDIVRRYVVPESDPVMQSLQCSSGAMQLICVDEILEALPRKWVLGEKLGVLRGTEGRSRDRSGDTLRLSIASLFGCLPPFVRRMAVASGCQLTICMRYWACRARWAVVRMSRLRTCCRQLQVRFVRRLSRLTMPRSRYRFAFLCKPRLSLVLDR